MKYNYIKDQWNARSDQPNNWDNISIEEKIEFAYKLGANIEDHKTKIEEEIWDDDSFEIISLEGARVNELYWAKWDDCGWSKDNKLLNVNGGDYPFSVEYIINGSKKVNNCSKIGLKR